jgi:mycobactin polyketide synthetase MbtD
VHGLTVAAETWDTRTDPAPPHTVRRVAVVDLPGPPADLGDRLRIAVQHHHSAQHVDPAEADLVVGVAPLLDHPDAEQAVGEISRAIGTGLLDYVDAAGPACREICLVTVGGEHVRPDEPVALPAQAALSAMHRSIGFERPEQVFRHLDLPSWEPDDATASAIVDALISDVREGAVRGGTAGPVLYARALPESVEPAPAWELDAGLLDDVVITGGSGTVGLHFARYLAHRGARRIVLLSRGGVDDAAKAELADNGVEILAPSCDVTSADQVSAAAQQHGGGGASLVIHAAGAATFADHDAITAAAFADTSAAKIGGLARLVELWPMRPDARILVCSSVSGVWGGRGHAAYSAANRMLDVMAGQLRAKGQHCTAARYGLWRGGGIADATQVTMIERSGLLPMAPEAAVAASLRDHAADPLLLTADHSRLKVFLESEVISETPARTTAPVTEADTGDRVRAELAAVLNLDPASIDLGMSLLDLGVDSLLALDLRKRLLRLTGTKVALATLLGGVTGDELIAGLESPERSEKVETTRD